MKRCVSWFLFLVLAIAPTMAFAQATVYWDRNGNAAGGLNGATFGDGNWTDANWNPVADGTGTPAVWTAGDHAVFSAGTDVQGDPIVDGVIEVSGTQVAGSLLVEEGHIWLNSGTVNINASTARVNPNSRLTILTSTQLSGTAGAKVILDGGTLFNANPGHAGSFLNANIGIELTANGGTIGYNNKYDQTPPTPPLQEGYSRRTSLYNLTNAAISITGNGPLTKVGSGEIRLQGIGQASNSYSKLIVKEGLIRTVGSAGNLDANNADRAFGAVPASVTADAITLDGGRIGTGIANVVLHANRGILIGPNGGWLDGGGGQDAYTFGGGGFLVNGPVSGSGTLTINGYIYGGTGIQNSANWGISQANVAATLNNANNTFSGPLVINTGQLTLNENFSPGSLTGAAVVSPPPTAPTGTTHPTTNVTTVGTISVASGKILTVGSNDQSTSYAGRVIGAGTFVKTGAGTLTLNTANAASPTSTAPSANFVGEWTNTGGVTINQGSVVFGTPLAGFAATAPVTVAAGATLDMNSVNDNFGSLTGAGTVSRTTGNITLAQSAATARTFSGQITGTGNLTKNGAWTQTFNQGSGNNSFGAVTVSTGALVLNGINTATGTTVAAAGTLGGNGSITGLVTVNGHVAPGSGGIGTFTAADGVTLNTGSILDFDLGAPGTSDLLNVTAAGAFNIAGSTTVNLASSGGLAAGSYTLIDYAGLLGGSFANLAIGTTPNPAFNYALQDTGSTIALNVTALAPANDADFNGDGTIDAADYVLWRKNNGSVPNGSGTQQNGDANGDTNVDGLDYNEWVKTFGNASPGSGGGGAVPEPASLAMLLVGLAALAGRRQLR